MSYKRDIKDILRIKILGFADDERSDEETYMKKYGKEGEQRRRLEAK